MRTFCQPEKTSLIAYPKKAIRLSIKGAREKAKAFECSGITFYGRPHVFSIANAIWQEMLLNVFRKFGVTFNLG